MCSLTMKHTWVVSTKCTPGFACRAFSDTTLVCFIVNEHTTKCSRYRHMLLKGFTGAWEVRWRLMGLVSLGVVSLKFRQLSKNILSKFVYCRTRTYMRTSNWSFARVSKAMLWARTEYQLEILIINVISGILYFHEMTLECWCENKTKMLV